MPTSTSKFSPHLEKSYFLLTTVKQKSVNPHYDSSFTKYSGTLSIASPRRKIAYRCSDGLRSTHVTCFSQWNVNRDDGCHTEAFRTGNVFVFLFPPLRPPRGPRKACSIRWQDVAQWPTCKGHGEDGFCFVWLLRHVLLSCDPVVYSPPGSSVHWIFQATILEWIAISFSRGCFQPRGQTCLSSIADGFFTTEPTRK